MQIEDLDQIRGYEHIYLSPHLDDAALSCGGAIAAQRASSAGVLVVTLCTASPAPDAQFSALAQEFHGQWGLTPDQAVAARLDEERQAMRALDADSYWAGLLDAIYRYPQAYNTRESLFGTPAPADPLLPVLRERIRALHERLPAATIYAPLGVGLHVDHQITHAAARAELGSAVRFYEDLPYAIRPGALQQRLATLNSQFNPTTLAIDATLPVKIAAIAAYSSQLRELFGGADAMRRQIEDYCRGLQPAGGVYGERLWALNM